MTTENHTQPAGRPTLEQQAENSHTNAEIRIDLEMGKLSLKAIKHLAKMMSKIDDFKENTQLSIVDKILRGNKEYMNAKREALRPSKESPVEEEEEDYTMAISLSSSDGTSKSLN